MTKLALQERLNQLAYDAGPEDGIYGHRTRAAVMRAMTLGPDTRLTIADLVDASKRLDVPLARIRAVDAVESNGDGFSEGRPTLLFEPHRFSRATGGSWDRSFPSVSYASWDPSRYPKTQRQRYLQLTIAVGLNVDAGFASASYGRFQILGENFAACGFENSFEFANAMAQDEAAQLLAFERFVTSKGLLEALRKGDWVTFARGYNGTAYKRNRYDIRLARFERNFSAVA